MSAQVYQPPHVAPFHVRQLKFMESGTYNDMYRRPYMTDMNPTLVAQFKEATHDGTMISPASLAGIAGEMARPQAQVSPTQDLIHIPNGWGERRFMFFMEVVYPSGFSNHTGVRQIISGSTDYVGKSVLTPGKIRLDPNMKMYLNSVVTIRATEVHGPNGPYIQETVVEDSQILNEPYQISAGGFNQGVNYAVALRPSDVFHTQQVQQYGQATTIDGRVNFSRGIKKSSRNHNLAGLYVAGLANAWQSANADEDETYGNTAGKAAGIVADPLTSKDRFFQSMDNARYLSQGGFLTYGELCYKQLGLDDMVEVSELDRRAVIQLHEVGQTEHWQGNHHEWVYATVLFQAVPALMIPLMMARLTMKVTNRTHGNVWDIRPTEVHGFQRMPIDDHRWNIFCQKLISEVLNDLTHRGMTDVGFDLTVDVLSESRITISVGGNHHPITLVQPTFADARLVPVVSNTASTLDKIANDMSMLCNNTQVDYGRQRMDAGIQPGMVMTPPGMGMGGYPTAQPFPTSPAAPAPAAGMDPNMLQKLMNEV